MKFQAIYRVTVYNQDSTVIIGAHEEKQQDGTIKLVQDEAQLTCHFTVSRGILSDSNKCTIRIYNLAPKTRELIFMDAFQGWDQSKWKFVKLEAGYDGDLSPVFMGRILQAYSYRSGGQTDIITEIQAQALDMFDYQTSYTFEAGTTFKDALQTIVTTSMPNVKIGNVGELNGEFKTPTTFDGNTMENISKLTGGNAFVDNDQLNVLMSNEVIDVPVPVITESNGLLDTPNRRDANLEVKMLFEPSLIVGQLFEIQSGVQPSFNGQYKVMGFTHDCTISGAQAGTRTTNVNLFIGPFLPGAEPSLKGNETGYASGFNKVKNFEVTPVTDTMKEMSWGVYRYIRNNNGKIPPWKVTPNISWREMLGNDNTDAERYAELTPKIIQNCEAAATQLQSIYDKHWKGYPLHISSGWRSQRNNANCGGKPNSKHLIGQAIDFSFYRKYDLNKAYKIMQKEWQGFILFEGSWIHADIRGFKGYANDV